ncbi:MAG: histidine phosphatase family protein [Planctomycetota bacterium]
MTGPAEEGAFRLVLIRAAETVFRRDRRLEGDVDLPLTDRGRADARRVAAGSGAVEAVYSAGNRSSRETAEIVAKGVGLPLKVLSGLRGLSYGLWEGQMLVDVRQRFSRAYESWQRDPFCITPPGGEEMEDALRRTKAATNTILRKHRKGTVAVVAPEAVIGLVHCHLGECPPDELFRLTSRMGHVETVTMNGRVRV